MTTHSSNNDRVDLPTSQQFYINGRWTPPAVPASLPVVNPATEEVVAEVARGSAEDVDRAVAAARAAF
ncbi:aldehyde dehydrogenase family protein, partial [Pseudomonas sp. 24 R 17]